MPWPSKDPADYAHRGRPEQTASVASLLMRYFFLLPGLLVVGDLTDGWVTWLVGALLVVAAAASAVVDIRRSRHSAASAKR